MAVDVKWHDMSEVPDVHRTIVVDLQFKTTRTIRHIKLNKWYIKDWRFIKRYGDCSAYQPISIRWCYFDELDKLVTWHDYKVADSPDRTFVVKHFYKTRVHIYKCTPRKNQISRWQFNDFTGDNSQWCYFDEII